MTSTAERQERRDESEVEERLAVRPLGDDEEDERRDGPRELDSDERLEDRAAQAHPQQREGPDQERGAGDQPAGADGQDDLGAERWLEHAHARGLAVGTSSCRSMVPVSSS
jgi:hypothetical protein